MRTLHNSALFIALCGLIGALISISINGCASTPKNILKDLNIPATSLTPDQWAFEKLQKNQIKLEVPLQYQITNLTTQQIVRLNVLGFLYQPDYSKQDSPEAIEASLKFIKKNRKTLERAEKKLGVSKEAITALLWVETRFGKKTGSYSLVNVFYQLIKADHPDLLQASLEELMKRKPDADFTLQKKCVDRSTTKANWALEQLKVLPQLPQVQKIKSSYAGAFGIPQFIPTSYFKYSLSSHNKKQANLFDVNDAIFSVGSFLAMSGWKESDSESHAKALFEYNRSKDYGAIILQLAQKLKQ